MCRFCKQFRLENPFFGISFKFHLNLVGVNFIISILNIIFTAFQVLSAQLSVTSRHTVLTRFLVSRLNVYFSCEMYIFWKAGYSTNYNCLVCTVCGIFPYRAIPRELAEHPIYFPHLFQLITQLCKQLLSTPYILKKGELAYQ